MFNNWQIRCQRDQWNEKSERQPLHQLWHIKRTWVWHVGWTVFLNNPIFAFFDLCPLFLVQQWVILINSPKQFPISVLLLSLTCNISFLHSCLPLGTASLSLPIFPFHFLFLCCSPSDASFPNVIASCPNFMLFSTQSSCSFSLSHSSLPTRHPSLSKIGMLNFAL